MSLFYAGLQPALDDNGDPISGAKWRFYASGTTTPVRVYSDADLGTSLGSFITADSSGRFAPAYFADGVGVRAVLEDAGGATISPYDIDPANAADSSVANVMAYGAVNDGTAHPLSEIFATLAAAQAVYSFVTALTQQRDWAALYAAVAALGANGGSVFIPGGAGLYITDSIPIANNNITIHGVGGTASNIQIPDHTFDLFNVTAGYTFTLKDVRITGYASSGGVSWAVSATATASILIDGVTVSGCHSAFELCCGITVVRNCTITDIKPTTGIGIDLSAAPVGEIARITDCIIGNDPGNDAFAGIYVARGSAIEIVNTQIYKCGTPVYANVATGVVLYSLVLNNVWCDTSTGRGMYLKTSGTGIITRVRADNCWFSTCLYGIDISGNVYGVTISDSEIFDNTNSGINVALGSVLNRMLIQGNRISGNGDDGIATAASITDFSILDNLIGPSADFGANAGYGIALGASNDNFNISGNDLRGNTTGALTGFSASSTTKIVKDNLGFFTESAGTATGTPNGSGDIVAAHGMSVTPQRVITSSYGATFVHVQVSAIDATNVTLRFFDAAGAAITAGTVTSYWSAAA